MNQSLNLLSPPVRAKNLIIPSREKPTLPLVVQIYLPSPIERNGRCQFIGRDDSTIWYYHAP